MSMYTPQIKEKVSENAKMLIIEDDGKVYRAEMPKKTVITFKGEDYKELYVNGEYVSTGMKIGSIIEFVDLGDKFDELKNKILDTDFFMEDNYKNKKISVEIGITKNFDEIRIEYKSGTNLYISFDLYRTYLE